MVPMLDRMHPDLSGDKELKVKIATRLHVQLHHMKIVHGKRIQDTVAEALESYFRTQVANVAPKAR